MTTSDAAPIDPTNADQARMWDGDEGAYWAANADHFDRALAGYDEPFFAAAGIEPGDRVLDVGCGTGGTTLAAARAASSGRVLGVDLSSAMLAVARQRAAAAGVGNVRFERADAQVHPFEPGHHDVAIGRTSAMFFGDRVAALGNIGRALRSGGRLVLLTWQPPSANEWLREFTAAMAGGRDGVTPPSDGPSPFSLSDPDVVRSVLDQAGQRDVVVEPITAPMWFGHDTDDAHRLMSGFLGWMLEGLDDAGRTRALDALRATIADHETRDGVLYRSAAWLITATRP